MTKKAIFTVGRSHRNRYRKFDLGCFASTQYMPAGFVHRGIISQVGKFMGPSWVPPGSCRPQMGPMLAPWTLLSGIVRRIDISKSRDSLFNPSCRFKIWQAVDAVQILKRLKNLKHIHHSLFRDFMRSYDRTSFCMMIIGPGYGCLVSTLCIPVSIN